MPFLLNALLHAAGLLLYVALLWTIERYAPGIIRRMEEPNDRT